MDEHGEFFGWLDEEQKLDDQIRNLRKKFKHFQSCFQYEKAKKEQLESLLIVFKEHQELKQKVDKRQIEEQSTKSGTIEMLIYS